MRISWLGLVLTMVIAGCDTVESMRDTIDTQEQLKGLIMEQIGVESLVRFNISNGTLIDVSFTLNAQDVANRSVHELERIVRSAVKKSFDSKPRAIYIQIATTAG